MSLVEISEWKRGKPAETDEDSLLLPGKRSAVRNTALFGYGETEKNQSYRSSVTRKADCSPNQSRSSIGQIAEAIKKISFQQDDDALEGNNTCMTDIVKAYIKPVVTSKAFSWDNNKCQTDCEEESDDDNEGISYNDEDCTQREVNNKGNKSQKDKLTKENDTKKVERKNKNVQYRLKRSDWKDERISDSNLVDALSTSYTDTESEEKKTRVKNKNKRNVRRNKNMQCRRTLGQQKEEESICSNMGKASNKNGYTRRHSSERNRRYGGNKTQLKDRGNKNRRKINRTYWRRTRGCRWNNDRNNPFGVENTLNSALLSERNARESTSGTNTESEVNETKVTTKTKGKSKTNKNTQYRRKMTRRQRNGEGIISPTVTVEEASSSLVNTVYQADDEDETVSSNKATGSIDADGARSHSKIKGKGRFQKGETRLKDTNNGKCRRNKNTQYLWKRRRRKAENITFLTVTVDETSREDNGRTGKKTRGGNNTTMENRQNDCKRKNKNLRCRHMRSRRGKVVDTTSSVAGVQREFADNIYPADDENESDSDYESFVRVSIVADRASSHGEISTKGSTNNTHAEFEDNESRVKNKNSQSNKNERYRWMKNRPMEETHGKSTEPESTYILLERVDSDPPVHKKRKPVFILVCSDMFNDVLIVCGLQSSVDSVYPLNQRSAEVVYDKPLNY